MTAEQRSVAPRRDVGEFACNQRHLMAHQHGACGGHPCPRRTYASSAWLATTNPLAVASVAPAPGAAVPSVGTLGPRPGARAPRLHQRPAPAPPLRLLSAAGPCGAWRSRSLQPKGDACWGGAPALMPKQAGARGTTDRRDAGLLARWARAGDRPPVSGPRVDDEASRALPRARAEGSSACHDAPGRLHACVRRQASRAAGRAPWGPGAPAGAGGRRVPTPAPPIVLPAEVRTVPAPTERHGRLAHDRRAPGTPGRVPPVGDALPALRAVPRCAPPRARLHGLGCVLQPMLLASGAPREGGQRLAPPRRAASGAKGPGRPALLRPSASNSHGASPPPQGGKTSVGRRRVGGPTRPTPGGHGQHAHGVTVARARALVGFGWALAHKGPRTLVSPPDHGCAPFLARQQWRRGAQGHAKRRSSGVVEPAAACRGPTGRRVPRWRQAPDGGPAGGSPPTERRRSHRRRFLPPPLFLRQGAHRDEDLKKKLFPTLDLGSHSNAAPQARRTAGLGRRKARCMTVRFLTPPVENRTYGFHRIRLSTFGRSPWGYHEASVSISAASTGLHPCLIPFRQHTRENSRGQLTRSPGTLCADYSLYFVLPKARGASPSVLILVSPAFLGSDSSAPSDSPCGPWRFVGGSLASFPLAFTSLTKSPVFRIEDSNGMLQVACSCWPPLALCGFSVSLQGRSGLPGVPLPCLIWLWPLLWPRSNHFGPD